MLRALLRLAALAALVAVGAVAVSYYQHRTASDRQLAAALDENQNLRDSVDRLTAERRVAELLVTDRSTGPDGVPRTTLLMQEFARDGRPIPPGRFTIAGTEAHLDATVVRFDHGFVAAGDALRGRSIALFTRVYGDRQTPADGQVVDGPARIGELDRGADPRVSLFQRSLWAQFWRLADDPVYRREQGVTTAGGQGVFFPAEFDHLYTVTLQADGGLSVSGAPLQGIYRDALHAKS